MTLRSQRAWVATRKGLFEWRRAAAGWSIERVHFPGEPVCMLLPPPPAGGRMLAALNLGHFGPKLHASDDGGDSWQELDGPAYPAQPEAAEGLAWALQQLWSIERDAAGRIWAGSLPGGLFVSADQGSTWALNRPLWDRPERLRWMGGGNPAPGLHSICPDPTKANDLLIAVSCGGVHASQDGGASWTPRTAGLQADFMPPDQQGDPETQDPHRVVRCTAVPEVLWCQHHCGIWRSTDNAVTWQRLHAPGSSFGFAVAAHPCDPLTAWFVPAVKDELRIPVGAALGVNRTRDGGQTWETLRTGLPQAHCYDLVYRHGLDVDASGECLLMGSTTGSLWVSEDGGESWTPLSTQLPPIYALRFE